MNILNVKYDIEGRNIETNEANEKKSISDYFKDPELKRSEQSKEKAVKADKKSETDLQKVVNSLGKLIHSDEMKQLEESLGDLTKKEYQKLSEYVDEYIVPELNKFKETLKDKGVFEKIDSFKQEAEKIIKDLSEKIKQLKENNEINTVAYRTIETKIALLKVAQKQQNDTIT